MAQECPPSNRTERPAMSNTRAPLSLTVRPSGARHFADGGKIDADELMRQMTAKYGAPSAGPAQAAPAQQPAPQPKAQARPEQQGLTPGIIGILKGRKEAIDKAAGYANGGKISGPGTPTSDSIPAIVRETGEGIRVSNGERIVSKEHDAYLESLAKAAGFESLDAMLEDGTGKPVGPTIKAGKRAAADGMAIDLDPFAYRGDKPVSGPAAGLTIKPGFQDSVAAAVAAPPSLGTPGIRTEPAGGALSGAPTKGLTLDAFGPKKDRPGSGTTGLELSLSPNQQPTKPGRDASGTITADSAPLALGNDMQRSGGVFGGIDMKGVNEIIARENKARGEMIDSMIAANGGNGVGILGDGGIEAANAEKTQRWALDDLRSGIKGAGTRTERAALGQALNQTIAGQNQQATEAIRQEGIARGQDLGYGARMAQQGLTARGQELGLQRAQERNDVIARGQDLRASTAADRTASNEAIAAARITERSGPTLSQQRGNAEISAARERIAGLTPEEIKRKSASFTATGRENPEYDESVSRAMKLAGRRMVGDDSDFDNRQQAQQPAGNDGDVMTRFRGDQAMKGYKLGKQTDRGHEVLDGAGNVLGHWN